MALRALGMLSFVAVLGALATSCGGERAGGAQSGAEAGAAGADTVAPLPFGAGLAQPERADSVPMDLTVTLAGGPMRDDGTYRASGNGVECRHNPNAGAAETSAEWTVRWARDNDPDVKLVQLQIGKTENGATNRLAAVVSAGRAEGLGGQVAAVYNIGAWGGGTQQGSGTARVERQGDGVRIELDGVAGTYNTAIKATVVCRRVN